VKTLNHVYIFCASYGEIKRTLYLAEKYSREHPIKIIIPGVHDLYLFFQEILKKNILPPSVSVIYFEHFAPAKVKAKVILKPWHVIPDIINERRYLKAIFQKYFAATEGCDVYFCSRGFDGYIFYLIKQLSSKNRIINTSPTPPKLDPIKQYFPSNIFDLARLAVYKLTYGLDVALGKLPQLKGFIFMTDKFMAKTVDEFISWEDMDAMLKHFDYGRYRVFNTGRYRVIYFDDSSLNAGYIPDKEVYRRELKSVFDILLKYYPENEIARKYHPSYPDDKTLITAGDILPDFIPAELLYDPNVDLYLSVYSFSLSNVEEGLAVSIGDLITFKNKEEGNTFKQNITQLSKTKILFPGSLEEFEHICSKLKKH
jgi:hypothetical protein